MSKETPETPETTAAESKEVQKAAKPKETQKAAKLKQVKLVATSNLSGKYLLPYGIGQKFAIDENQAEELIKNKDAKKV